MSSGSFFNDLLGLLRKDLMASNVIEVGIIPFEDKFEIQTIF